MTVRRRGRRVKTGPGTYANYDSRGQLSSTSSRLGDTTSTVFLKGGVRTSTNFGGGYFNVLDSRRGGPKPRRGAKDRGGTGIALALAVAFLILLGAYRIVAWLAALAYERYRDRRGS